MRSLHFACLILLFILSCKKTDLNGTRYEDEVFDKVKSEKNIEYGENINFVGINEKLHLDIYEPKGDNETNRPVIFFTHGGGFITGSKTDQCIVKFCKDFAKKGYVTVSMHYRIGIALPVNEQHGLEAVIRAMHDAKAAVRFIRKTAGEDGNPYNIDPDQIYFAGISAGAITGLQAAYLDQESELPVEVDFSKKSLKGGLEGSTNDHYSYSSIPNAVINIDGAIKDTSWITNNDIPLLSFHGSDDTFVPFDSDFQEFMGEPITHVHGSQSIHARMNNLSNNNCFKAYWGKDHIPECLETAYRDTTTVMITNFLVELQTDASHACVYE